MTIESPKQKRGGTNKKNRNAAAQTKKTEARRGEPPEGQCYYSTL